MGALSMGALSIGDLEAMDDLEAALSALLGGVFLSAVFCTVFEAAFWTAGFFLAAERPAGASTSTSSDSAKLLVFTPE